MKTVWIGLSMENELGMYVHCGFTSFRTRVLILLGSPLEFYLLDIHFEVLHFFRFEIKPTDHFKCQSSKLFIHLID